MTQQFTNWLFIMRASLLSLFIVTGLWFTVDYVRYEEVGQKSLLDNTSYLQITFGLPTVVLFELL